MRTSRLKLYAPFLALLLLQGAIMVLAPSVGEQQPAAFDDGPGDGSGLAAPEPGAGHTADGARTGADSDDTVVDGAPTIDDPTGGAQGSSGTADGTADPTGEESGAGTDTTASTNAQGDTSHCTDDGRQHGSFFHAPPCEPASDGTNPGATYTGVTEDEILVIMMSNMGHPLLDAILPSSVSDAESDEFRLAAQDFINSHYELHGRQVRIEVLSASFCDAGRG